MEKNKLFFKYNNEIYLLMKKEYIGEKISILYFKSNEKKEITNSHVQFMIINKKEYQDIEWIT